MESKDEVELRKSRELLRPWPWDEAENELGGGGGSHPLCSTPSIQIDSVHLSGVESLSKRYRTALSKWPFPLFAAVRRTLLLLDDGEGELERIEGSERSVVEPEKVCANHPFRRRDMDEGEPTELELEEGTIEEVEREVEFELGEEGISTCLLIVIDNVTVVGATLRDHCIQQLIPTIPSFFLPATMSKRKQDSDSESDVVSPFILLSIKHNSQDALVESDRRRF